MLLVCVICFEGRFSKGWYNRKWVGVTLWLAVEGPLLALARQAIFLHFAFLRGLHFWHCSQFSVSRSICWLKTPDHCKLPNVGVAKVMNLKRIGGRTLAQMSLASSQQKW